MKKHRVGIIGYGYWGETWASKIQNSQFFELAGIVSKDTSKNINQKQFHFISEKHLFADPSINLIIITTAVKNHFQLVKKTLESGKNVLVAKPPFLSLADYEEIIALKRKMGKEVYVENIYLFHPYFLKIKELIGHKKIKYYQSIRCQFGKFQTQSNVIQELMFHDIFMLFDLTDGNILKDIKSQTLTVNSLNSDVASFSLTFQQDMRALFFSSFNSINKNRSVTITGERFAIEWSESQSNLIEFASISHDESNNNYAHEISGKKTFNNISGDAIENFIEVINSDMNMTENSNSKIKLEYTYDVFKLITEKGANVFN